MVIKTKDLKPRNPFVLEAMKLKAGPMGDRRKKRMKDKEERQLREEIEEAMEVSQ